MDDHELLRRFEQSRSQDAFRELVDRHLAMVLSSARRMVRDAQLAEEVAQGVFTTLAQKAGSISPPQVVGGWLYNTTRHLAMHAVRTEQRRREREQIAVTMQSLEANSDVDQITEQLEPAMAELETDERDALVLRYLENRSLREVGAEFGISEDAARMRVNRALERLRTVFARQGISATSVLLGTVLVSSTASSAVPAGLAATLTTAALAGTTTAVTATATITKAIAMTTLQKTLITATIVAAGVATPLFIQHQAQVKLREENQSLRQEVEQLAQLQAENQRLSNLVVQANSSQFPLNELLRLRGEVGSLRRQNAELAAQKSSVGQSNFASEASAKTPPSETEPFRSKVHTPVDFGQTLITGGWSTAPGRRMLVFVKPEAGQTAAGAQTITLRSTGIEIPESLLGAHGLTTLASEARQTVQHGQLSTSAEAEALLRELAKAANSQPIALSKITTFPGQSAEIQVGNSAGGRMNLTATPNLAPDGKGFDLQLDAVLNASVQGK